MQGSQADPTPESAQASSSSSRKASRRSADIAQPQEEGAGRYRLHVSLISGSGDESVPIIVSDFFSTPCEALDRSKGSKVDLSSAGKEHQHPAQILDPRLGPLVMSGGGTTTTGGTAITTTTSGTATTATTTWRSQFNQSASFTVDEDSESPSEVVFGILHLFKDNEQSGSATTTTALDDESGTILAVLGLPSQITAAEFLSWVEPAKDSLEKMRMIRELNLSRCTVLMKFRDPINAEEFYKQFSQQPVPYFGSRGVDGAATSEATSSSSSLPPTPLAHIVYITQVTVSTSPRLPYAYPQLANSDPWPLAPVSSEVASAATKDENGTTSQPDDPAARLALSLAQELPTCPVCLERMDSNVTGLMTVSCQHTFHCDCLSRWGDARCPVCRYSQTRSAARFGRGPSQPHTHQEEASKCTLCDSTDDLWVCLICATVGCGRYKKGCAKQHFVESGHIYSLELETSRVWDYVHDGYVHRLIQNRADGKLVELPSTSHSTPRRSRRRRRHARRSRGEGSSAVDANAADSDDYSSDSSSSDYDKHAAEKSDGKLGTSSEKLEAISLEYQYLLCNQLESQRAYYEEQVRHLQSELTNLRSTESQNATAALREREAEYESQANSWEAQLNLASEREKRLTEKYEKSLSIASKLSRDFQAERSLSKGLMDRVEKLTSSERAHKEQMEVMQLSLRSTQEQVNDLMFALSLRDKEEIQGGDLVLGQAKDAEEGGKAQASKKKKKKKGPAKPPDSLRLRAGGEAESAVKEGETAAGATTPDEAE